MQTFISRCRQDRGRRAGSTASIEALEARQLLSVYFVSASGSDGAPGTLAQPFATIQKAAALAQPGDMVFIRGGTYHETVVPANSGAAAAPIVYEPYNGEPVTISGADPVGGWTPSQGAVYQAAQPWDLGPGNGQVFVDGAMMNEARWPNTAVGTLFNYTTATADTLSSSTPPAGPFGQTATATINSSALTQPAGYWNGATIHIPPGDGWVWQTGTVISSQPGQLTYQYTQLNLVYQIPRSGNPFYLTGKFQELDAPGEWYHDANSGALYLQTPQSDNPALHDVEVKHRQFAFDLSGLSFIDIRGFNLFAASINSSATSHDLTLSNLNAQYISQSTIDPNPFDAKNHPPTTGLILAGANEVLRDSTIAFSSGNGIAVTANNSIVQNCFIHDIGYSGGDDGAILLAGNNDQVIDNTAWNLGRNGITQYFAGAERIAHNVVHDFGLLTSDAGGIYAWETDGAGTEVSFNQVFNGHSGGFGNTGVFLDNNSSHFILDHNVVWDADNAMKLNNPARFNQVYNNTLIGTIFSFGTSFPSDMTGTIVENNLLVGPTGFGSGVVQQHNLASASPGFVDAAANNYQLAAGSPAIDAGLVVPPYTNGFMGAAPDIGAYEFGAAPFAAGATAVPTPVFTPPPPVGGSPPTSRGPRSAASVIAASSFDTSGGVQINSDLSITASAGGFVQFAQIDFGLGVRTVQMIVAGLGKRLGIRIQLRLDSPGGPVIATLHPSRPRRGQTFRVQTAHVRRVSGVHALFLIFTGAAGQAQVEAFQFIPIPVRVGQHPRH